MYAVQVHAFPASIVSAIVFQRGNNKFLCLGDCRSTVFDAVHYVGVFVNLRCILQQREEFVFGKTAQVNAAQPKVGKTDIAEINRVKIKIVGVNAVCVERCQINHAKSARR